MGTAIRLSPAALGINGRNKWSQIDDCNGDTNLGCARLRAQGTGSRKRVKRPGCPKITPSNPRGPARQATLMFCNALQGWLQTHKCSKCCKNHRSARLGGAKGGHCGDYIEGGGSTCPSRGRARRRRAAGTITQHTPILSSTIESSRCSQPLSSRRPARHHPTIHLEDAVWG